MKELNIVVKLGDITKEKVDAIVNAANNELKGGGGVDGAIHAAAGPELDEACKKIGWCETGDAVVTPAFGIKDVEYIIHTVGPKTDGHASHDQCSQLQLAYLNSLKLANNLRCKTVSFPSISTGIFKFPLTYATNVFKSAILHFQEENEYVEEVRMVCFDEETKEAYEKTISNMAESWRF